MARPTKYDPGILESVTNYCVLGCTDEELAEFLSISVATLNTWKQKPEFLEAIKKGKAFADMRVANSLYQKALDGDTTAMIFWLKNRRKEHWRDKQSHELSGSVGVNTIRLVGV